MNTPGLAKDSSRLISLDQFRGYTVVGMFLVNYAGRFAAIPPILKHHNDYCSYADTIMPHFLFAVGFAFRLTFERRVQKEGVAAAYSRVVRRLFGLVLVAIVVYSATAPAETWEQLRLLGIRALATPLKRDWFQTLMHIAATSLWILPVIRTSAGVRISFALVSAIVHIGLSWWFNFTWCNTPPNGIDGGPLGFLTWTIPAIAGTLACDLVTSANGKSRWTGLLGGAALLMALGWGFSCGTRLYDVPPEQVEAHREIKLAEHPVIPPPEQHVYRGLAEPPFVPPPDHTLRKWNYWMMSQRAGTLSYLTFCAGLSLAVYALFHLLCDVMRWELYPLKVFGTNALVGYILHNIVANAIHPFVPRDAPGWYVWLSIALFFAIMWIFIRHLEKNNVFLRL